MAPTFVSFCLVVFLLAVPSFSLTTPHKRDVNSPEDRRSWGDYDISTNYYEEWPETGVTREYWFNIVNTTAAPDGVERPVLSVNDQFPGPTIIADWGDTVVVHVTNHLENNGTGIHFHGVRQLNTNQMDGASSITQCPIPPGASYTYTWQATQYGTGWWHSHFYLQAWDGVAGGIIINGPASTNYDEDLGTLLLNDWDHQTADQKYIEAHHYKTTTMLTGLMNGTNVWDGSGSYFETKFESGKKYRLRLISGAADAHFKFTIDNHKFEVIATDFVPIQPYTADIVRLSEGQRYDIVITANASTNATSEAFWMRAIIQGACSQNSNPNVLGIVRYGESSTALPQSTAWADASVDDCRDEDMSLLVPYLPIAASNSPDVTQDYDMTVNDTDLVYWTMGTSTFVSQWDYPTLLQIADGNDTWTEHQNMVQLSTANEWVYWVLQATTSQPHPMHLHGHDFWVLAQGDGTYEAGAVDLTLVNAPRRDTVQVLGHGYAVIAFKTDNPGAWLMHCHIAWHNSEGLAIQILEEPSAMTIDDDALRSTCTGWDTWSAKAAVAQHDSGI